jgi:RNA recognition motif-containing protein
MNHERGLLALLPWETKSITRLSNVAWLRLMAMADAIQPNTTLYINNLNDKVNKEEIRSQLYALFTTYGKLIDVVATKTPKMRGQAFLVFTDLTSATAALRACDGMVFYDKPMVCAFYASRFAAHAESTRSTSHMQRANPMPLCVVRILTSSHQALPTLPLQSVYVRLRI